MIETPSTTIVTMMSASTFCPSDPAIALATSRMTTSGIGEEVKQLDNGREAPDRSGLIRAVRSEAPCRLGTAQSLFGVGHQPLNSMSPSRLRATRRASFFRHSTRRLF